MKKDKPFTGQLMTCVVCGKQAISNLNIESQWRYLELDNDGFYACPDEYPPDGSGKKAFESAYMAVLSCCLNEVTRAAGGNASPAIERYRLQRSQGLISANSKRKSKGFS